MLIEFSVENYLSFKDKVTFSMLANEEDKSNKDNIFYCETLGQNLLKTAVIYGANASGKSNLLKALSAIKTIILTSHKTLPSEEIFPNFYFLLDTKCFFEPIKFDLLFVHENTKYAYGFTYNHTKFLEEYLYYWEENEQKRIFERTNTTEFEFNDTSEEPNILASRTKENTLFLSASNQWNYEPTRKALDWINNFLYIDLFKQINTLNNLLINRLKIDNDFKKQVLVYLNNIADIGIIDITIDKNDNIITIHKGLTNNDTIHNISFNLLMESDGTIKFIHLLFLLISMLETASIIFIDELNLHLHPLLTNFIIDLFKKSETNPKNAQLIFTTHDVNQLDLNKFRKDQIYFTEKNPETGSSDLYSLDEVDGVQDDENIRKGYLQGRYGAIPIIGNAHLSWKEKN